MKVPSELKIAQEVIGDLTLRPIGALGRMLMGRTLSWWVERAILALVFVRVGLYILETDWIHSANSRRSPFIFLGIERCIATVFTIEYFVRWRNSENPRLWPRRVNAIIDLLSVLPFWIGFFVPHSWLGVIRSLRIISLLKLYRYSPKAQMVMKEIARMKAILGNIIFFTIALVMMCGALMYEIESKAQPDKFHGVLDGIWWGIATASTTGYGDIYPITPAGRILAGLMMLFGAAVIGSYIGLFGTAVGRAFRIEIAAQDAAHYEEMTRAAKSVETERSSGKSPPTPVERGPIEDY
jgi:voltage-gated potassium channel